MKLFTGAFAAAFLSLSFPMNDAVADDGNGPTILAHCGGCGAGAAKQHKHTTKVKKAKKIAQHVIASGDLSTLKTALEAAGLVDALNAKGPFTLFAPSDKAFKAMDQKALKEALSDPKGKLAKILKHHVVAKKIDASDITKPMKVETLAGTKIGVAPGKVVVINGKAKVVKASIQTENGVIHVIDTVLVP